MSSSSAMAPLVRVTALPGVLGSIVQFGGLRFAGMLASLSKATNMSMKGDLAFALKRLRAIGVVIDRPLLLAALIGHTPAVSALLDAGADTNTVDDTGTTPLSIAADKDTVDDTGTTP